MASTSPGEALDQVALAVLLEEVRGQVLDVPEDLRAQSEDESLRGPGGEGVAEVADQRAQHGDAQPGSGRAPEGGQRAGLQGVVGELREQQDRGGLGERGHHHAGDDRRQPLAVAAGQRPETAEGLADFPHVDSLSCRSWWRTCRQRADRRTGHGRGGAPGARRRSLTGGPASRRGLSPCGRPGGASGRRPSSARAWWPSWAPGRACGSSSRGAILWKLMSVSLSADSSATVPLPICCNYL